MEFTTDEKHTIKSLVSTEDMRLDGMVVSRAIEQARMMTGSKDATIDTYRETLLSIVAKIGKV